MSRALRVLSLHLLGVAVGRRTGAAAPATCRCFHTQLVGCIPLGPEACRGGAAAPGERGSRACCACCAAVHIRWIRRPALSGAGE
jgi:hypothetical protein